MWSLISSQSRDLRRPHVVQLGRELDEIIYRETLIKDTKCSEYEGGKGRSWNCVCARVQALACVYVDFLLLFFFMSKLEKLAAPLCVLLFV